MLKRNDAIEISATKAFCEKFNASVIERPNPPEAIIEYQYSSDRTWLEVTTLWEDRGQKKHEVFARALNNPKLSVEFQDISSASPDDLAYKLKCELIHSIQKKNGKPSYDPFIKKYGKGKLILVSEFNSINPRFLDQHPEILNFGFREELKTFDALFLYIHVMCDFFPFGHGPGLGPGLERKKVAHGVYSFLHRMPQGSYNFLSFHSYFSRCCIGKIPLVPSLVCKFA